MAHVENNTRVVVNSRTGGKTWLRWVNEKEHLVVNMMPIAGDTVMNEIFYPDDELASSYQQLNNLPAPDKHPTVEGVPVSAFHPMAINSQHFGASVRNPKKRGREVNAELWIDREFANRNDRGQEITRAIENGERVGVSTGMTIKVANERGSFGGKDFTMRASNFRFDHVAILLGKKPAGADTFLLNEENGEESLVYVCNVDEAEAEQKTKEDNERKPIAMEPQEMIEALEKPGTHKVINADEHADFLEFKTARDAKREAARSALVTKSGLEPEAVAGMTIEAVNALLDKFAQLETDTETKIAAANAEAVVTAEAKAKAEAEAERVRVDNSLRAGGDEPEKETPEGDAIAETMGL